VDKLKDLKGLRFHDLRHTWKTNARRSGTDPEIREAILGHSTLARSASERYGHISDEEFVRAIDGMIFDHGDTVIRGNLRGGKKNANETPKTSSLKNISTSLANVANRKSARLVSA